MQTQISKVKPHNLKLLEKNARYMPNAQFQQLVANVRKDGKLTSTPLVYRGEVLSGNHRVLAARVAGLDEIEVMEVMTELSEAQRTAIQLSHNALNGKDDPNTLKELFSLLPADEKEYSGLTDTDLADLGINSVTLDCGSVLYREFRISFIPENAEIFLGYLDKIGKLKNKPPVLIGRLDDFGVFFDAIVRVKEKLDITNHALALVAMAELASAKLAEMDE